MTDALDALASAIGEGSHSCYYLDPDKVLAALRERGFDVVPIRPTDGMLAEADSAMPRFEEDEDGHRLMGVDGARAAWDAMLRVGHRGGA